MDQRPKSQKKFFKENIGVIIYDLGQGIWFLRYTS